MADLKELEGVDEKAKLNEESDTAKIKFQPSKNGEAKIEMPDTGVGYQCGMSKDELLKFANDPFWIAVRRVMFVMFWLLWVGMLVGAVAIIITTPGCAKPKEPEWYETSPLYELRVDEFFDGDGDQKSDLSGIQKKLSYFEDISISAVVLDGLFNADSPKTIDPALGSFDVFQSLASSLKLVVKVPVSKVDLNSDQKQAEFVDSLRFWMEKDAAGFVFDELELLPPSVDLVSLTGQWHKLVRNFSTEEFPRVSILSSYKNLDEAEYCPNANMVLNYKPTELTSTFTADQLIDVLSHTVERNKTCRSNLVLGNGDIKPLMNRVDSSRDRLLLFSMLADATPLVYFGDEYAKDGADMPSVLTRNHGKVPPPMNWQTISDMQANVNNYFSVFKDAAKLRHNQGSIRMGETTLKKLGDNIVAMSRIKKNSPGFAIVTNFGEDDVRVNLGELNEHIPESGDVSTKSSNSKHKDLRVNLYDLEIGGQETLVLEFASKF